MAFTYGFYNSRDGDRRYDTEQWSEIYDGVINDGVFMSVGDHFAVRAGSGLQVIVGTGRAWFDHTWSKNDSDYPLNIATPDVTMRRIDAVVLQTDHTETSRLNSLRVVQGVPDLNNPQRPNMVHTDKINQHPLAYVTVRPGAEQILTTDIAIVVGQSVCPFVTSILETTNIDALFSNWTKQFQDWFSNIKSQLAGDIATNLQRQIDDHWERTIDDTTRNALGVPASYNPKDLFVYLYGFIKRIMGDSGELTLTVQTAGGKALNGIEIANLKDSNGNNAVTNSSGIAKGYVASGSTTLTIGNYADITPYSKTYSITKGGVYTDTWKLTTRNFVKYSKSQSVKFSRNVTRIDVCVGGGGGGGAGGVMVESASQGTGGGAGAGGYCTTKTNVSFSPETLYPMVIGAGGEGAQGRYTATGNQGGGTGGTSTFLGVTGTGGGGAGVDSSPSNWYLGGNGNGNGGAGGRRNFNSATSDPVSGSAGTQTMYSSFTATVDYGGGGGGGGVAGAAGATATGAAGAGYGGKGGILRYDGQDNLLTDTPPAKGTDGFGGGGGGGSSIIYSKDSRHMQKGADGGCGGVAIRMTLTNT